MNIEKIESSIVPDHLNILDTKMSIEDQKIWRALLGTGNNQDSVGFAPMVDFSGYAGKITTAA